MSRLCRFKVRPNSVWKEHVAQEGWRGSSWAVPRAGRQESRESRAGPPESPRLGFNEPAGHQVGGDFQVRESSGRLPSCVCSDGGESDRALVCLPRGRKSRQGATLMTSSDHEHLPKNQLQILHMGGWVSTHGFWGDTNIQSTAIHLGSHGPWSPRVPSHPLSPCWVGDGEGWGQGGMQTGR